MARISRFTGTNFLCKASPYGFGIRFYVAEDKSVFVTTQFDEHKQGGQGILHGGAIAAVLDEAMGTAAFEAGSPGYTATMTYNYKSHIPLNQDVTIRAWIEKQEAKKVFAACEAVLADGTVAVTGTALFIASDQLKDLMERYPYIPEDEN
jgi:acyl-coenzyme A thioesterase PaaI-like protein